MNERTNERTKRKQKIFRKHASTILHINDNHELHTRKHTAHERDKALASRSATETGQQVAIGSFHDL